MSRLKTGFGPVRLRKYLLRSGLDIPPSTIRNIIRGNNLVKSHKKKKRRNLKTYNMDALYPLEHFQIDLKHILDFDTLPTEVYNHIRDKGFPPYQWTSIDVKTRIRFIAYSYEKTASNGLFFLYLVGNWLRSFGIHRKIYFQTDWGEEFGGKSMKKIHQIQTNILSPLNIQLLRIRKGHSEDNAYVERSHRTDDEEFYIPETLKIPDKENFLFRAFKWLWTYNTKRPHYGQNMNGSTPLEKLLSLMPWINYKICAFPPIILDEITTNPPLSLLPPTPPFFSLPSWSIADTSTVHDVSAHYQIL
jgi:transposase InsO family protein